MAGSLHQEGNRINLAHSQKDVLICEMMITSPSDLPDHLVFLSFGL